MEEEENKNKNGSLRTATPCSGGGGGDEERAWAQPQFGMPHAEEEEQFSQKGSPMPRRNFSKMLPSAI